MLTFGASAALAKLCALLVATRALALAKLSAPFAAAALVLLALPTRCGRLPSRAPHVTLEGLGRHRGCANHEVSTAEAPSV